MKRNSRQVPPSAVEPPGHLPASPAPGRTEDRSQPIEPASEQDAKLLSIGRLVGTHGIRGELKLLTYNPQSEAIFPGIRVALMRPGHRDADGKKAAAPEMKVLTAVRPHQRLLLIRFDDCDSMTSAEAWVGAEVCVAASDLPESGPDELYHYELIGMDVVTVDGTELGRVVEILETGANDVCTVRGRGREYLIPLIAEVVKTIDKEARRLVIDPLPGLLDL